MKNKLKPENSDCVMSHDHCPSPITNCHTFLDPLECDILNGRPQWSWTAWQILCFILQGVFMYVDSQSNYGYIANKAEILPGPSAQWFVFCCWTTIILRSLLLRLAAVIEYRWVLKYKLLVQFFGPIFRSKKNIEKKIQIWVASVWYIVANFCPNWAIYKNGAPGAFLDKLKIRWRILPLSFARNWMYTASIYE